MASGTRIPGSEFVLPDNVLVPATWSGSSGHEFPLAKQRLLIPIFTAFMLDFDDTPVSKRVVAFRAWAAGTILQAGHLLREAGSSTDIDLIVRKSASGANTGTSLMSADCTLVHGTGDNTPAIASLTSTAIAIGDLIELEAVVTSATGASGHLAWILIDTLAP